MQLYIKTDRHIHIKANLRIILLKNRKFFERICGQNQVSYFRFQNFLSENCVVYKLLWNNMVQTDRHGTHDDIIRHDRFACQLDKAINTHSGYVQYIPFHGNNRYTSTQKCYSYTYIVCLVLCLSLTVVPLIYINQ